MPNLQHYLNMCVDPKFGEYAINNEIIVTPFWKPEFCAGLVEYCQNNRHLFDVDPSYKTEELNLTLFDMALFEDFKYHYSEFLIPFVRKFWHLDNTIQGIVSPYIIRYTQTSLRKDIDLHVDQSVFTIYIKLNSDYGEGTLKFPRQNWSSADVPVGHMIIWPSMLTHPHYADKITTGEKYSLVGHNYTFELAPNRKFKF